MFGNGTKRRLRTIGGRSFRPIFALAALLLFACTAIDTQHKVAGWPQLAVVEHYVPDGDMRTRCSKYVGFGMTPEACAEFDFAHGKCHIWYSEEYPPLPGVIAHERLHCQGYEHPGDSALAQALARYRLKMVTVTN